MSEPLDPANHQPAEDLLDRFAVFREPAVRSAATDGPEVAHGVQRLLVAMGDRWGLLSARATEVAATPEITMLLIPGSTGVGVMIVERRADGSVVRWGSGADLEVVLRGDPICESSRPDGGRLIFGIAPDGVTEQSIRLADDSSIRAPVNRNVYTAARPAPPAAPSGSPTD